ncbi:MAG: hypothetical protein ACRDT1_07255, partial [Micromonosporaceae bacterium]
MTVVETPPATPVPEPPKAPGTPRRRRVLRRITRSPLALGGLIVLLVAILLALLAPMIAPYSASDVHFDDAFTPPGGSQFLLGTDDLGRDLASRIMYGLQ